MDWAKSASDRLLWSQASIRRGVWSNLKPGSKFDHTPRLIEMAYDAFGPRRMMWGSDYPPVSGREGYRNALEGVAHHPVLEDPNDREWVMGRTGLELFKL